MEILLLLPVLIPILFFLLVTWLIRRAVRRRQQALEDEQRRRGAAGDDDAGGGFGAFPFGNLFQNVLFPGMWTRSYAYDERTGQWVDITDVDPAELEDGAATTTERRASTASGQALPPPPGVSSRPSRSSARRRAEPERSTRRGPMAMGGLGGLLGDGSGDFRVERPNELRTFADVGGMEHLKTEIRDSVGLLLQHPGDAETYGIEWNGILLFGPPGVGETFFASAIAGEYRLNFIHVSTGDLVSSLQGGSARNIDKAFDSAMRNLPCVLFFDEFDSVAQRRDNSPDQESRRTVNQLLTSLEAHRDERRLLVMAATNSIDHLDPAVVRPGRFDRHIRIDLPDADARRAIFRAELRQRPTTHDVDLEDLVRRTEGMTPAAISKIVDSAALDVFRESMHGGRRLELDERHLRAAIDRYGGQDRPTVEHWTWDSLILPETIKAQLRQLQHVIEDPDAATRFGVEPPTGLLLAGPPGTGKTTVAKVLAAQARCSFYPISGADVMSKWVGESERNIRQLFERARENRPSIIFIDEIDAIAGRRGEVAVRDSQVNQLLAEIDGVTGQRGVFIVGATNRPDQIDPALLRGGRLSRTVVLGLPDEPARVAILRRYSERMPTVAVSLEDLARATEGMSPADLKALCQEAAMAAMARAEGRGAPGVTQRDFLEALDRLRPRERAAS